MKIDFDYIRKNGYLVYEYIRGSHAYGLATETSDVDTAGVYILPIDHLLGLPGSYQSQISDEKGDTVWYELSRFLELLGKSNPTVLESLFIPDDCIIYEHPIIKKIKQYSELFLTKKCFAPFGGYAVSQIKKAHGYKKKIVSPVTTRRGILDFCYTFQYKDSQGSTKIENWLSHRGLHQEFCGLVNVPNMIGTYGVYYDWGAHFQKTGITSEDLINAWSGISDNPEIKNQAELIILSEGLRSPYSQSIPFWFESKKPIGYRGMVKPDSDSNELRLSSVEKGSRPIANIQYNKDGYTLHCKEYKEYKEWEQNRNQARFDDNKGHQFDAKNMCHSFRLVKMCIEIASGFGFNVRRTEDRDFLLGIKNHKYSYDDLIQALEKLKLEMDSAIEKSNLPEKLDREFLEDLLISIRQRYMEDSEFINRFKSVVSEKTGSVNNLTEKIGVNYYRRYRILGYLSDNRDPENPKDTDTWQITLEGKNFAKECGIKETIFDRISGWWKKFSGK